MTTKEQIEERWDVVMTDVARFKDESDISSVNSKRWRRINDTLEEIAAMLVQQEVHDNEMGSLQEVTENIWSEIKEHLFVWAEMIEKGRADWRKANLKSA